MADSHNMYKLEIRAQDSTRISAGSTQYNGGASVDYHWSIDDNYTETVSFMAPAASPYSGARFTVSIRSTAACNSLSPGKDLPLFCWDHSPSPLRSQGSPELPPEFPEFRTDDPANISPEDRRTSSCIPAFSATLDSCSSTSTPDHAGLHEFSRLTALHSRTPRAPISTEWTWLSEIYHPIFSAGTPLCRQCWLHDRTSAETLVDILLLLEKPHYCAARCAHCPANNAKAFAEAKTDTFFFQRKARVRTPGAQPLSDDVLRNMATLDLASILKSGAFSDVKMVVGRTIFHCHRTVLAARVPALSMLFKQGDGGVVKVTETACPVTFARCLQYIYCTRLLSQDALSIDDHIRMHELAFRYGIAQLANYHFSCVTALVNSTNAYHVLTASQLGCDPLLVTYLHIFIQGLAVPNERMEPPSPVPCALPCSRAYQVSFPSARPSDDLACTVGRGPTRRRLRRPSHERHSPY